MNEMYEDRYEANGEHKRYIPPHQRKRGLKRICAILLSAVLSSGTLFVLSPLGSARAEEEASIFAGKMTWSRFNEAPSEEPDAATLASGTSDGKALMGEADSMYHEALSEYLPTVWDNRLVGALSSIRNQGDQSTCWAFAALGAMEASLSPEHKEEFSVDHMTTYSGFGEAAYSGGTLPMALAYFSCWRGPVREADDPYNDGETNFEAPVRYHLQEAVLLNGSRMSVKSAILQYGAVQSSMYADYDSLLSHTSTTFFNAENNAYYYNGTEDTNHDVLVVGWDDRYPAERFATRPEGDGAFICQNSWGEAFGDQGYFYVSYYDSCLINNSIVYTRIDEIGVYDSIYQNDELGWVAQMGFNEQSAYGANVYTVESDELLSAISFYATQPAVDYELYVDLKPDTETFAGRSLVAQGHLENAGYYTIDLQDPIKLFSGQKFAVILKMTMQNKGNPLAVETGRAVLEVKSAGGLDPLPEPEIGEGQSYLSADGKIWIDAGETLSCNLCLKVFTRKNPGSQ